MCSITSGYTLKTTGLSASFKNLIAKIPQQTLSAMMCALLSGTNLSYIYWSCAIRHYVYIKTKLLHKDRQRRIAPFKAYNLRRPDFIHVHVSGNHVIV